MRGACFEVWETEAGAVSIEYQGRALPSALHSAQEREQGRVVEPKLLDAALSRPADAGKVSDGAWRRIIRGASLTTRRSQ